MTCAGFISVCPRANEFSPLGKHIEVNGEYKRTYQVEQHSYYQHTNYIYKNARFGHLGYLDAPAAENDGVGRSCHRHHEGAGR